MAGSKKSLGLVVYLLSSSCSWGLYVICLILTCKEIYDGYRKDELHHSVVAKEVVAFMIIPQCIAALFYFLSITAFIMDVLSKERRRIHFLTTSYTNAVSMGFFLSAGFAMFINLALMAFVAMQHSAMQDYDEVGSGSYHVNAAVVSHDHVLAGAFKQIEIASHWAKTLFFCVSVMLVLYSAYFCYWPHSLRYRRRVDKRLLSNIGDIDDDDDDNL